MRPHFVSEALQSGAFEVDDAVNVKRSERADIVLVNFMNSGRQSGFPGALRREVAGILKVARKHGPAFLRHEIGFLYPARAKQVQPAPAVDPVGESYSSSMSSIGELRDEV